MRTRQRAPRQLLFAAPVAAAAILALHAWRVERAVEAIEDAGGTVTRRPSGPDWIHESIERWTGSSPGVLDRVEGISFRFQPAVEPRVLADLTRRMAVFRELEALDLCGTPADADVVRFVSRLPLLQRLDLSHTAVMDSDLAMLASLKNLQRLSLAGTQVDDAGLEHLLKLERLEDLDLDGTRVTDRGMLLLRQLPRLVSLSVSNTGVTDAGLERLWERRPEVAVADD